MLGESEERDTWARANERLHKECRQAAIAAEVPENPTKQRRYTVGGGLQTKTHSIGTALPTATDPGTRTTSKASRLRCGADPSLVGSSGEKAALRAEALIANPQGDTRDATETVGQAEMTTGSLWEREEADAARAPVGSRAIRRRAEIASRARATHETPAAEDNQPVARAEATPAVVGPPAVDTHLAVGLAEATPAVVDLAAVDIQQVDRAEATPAAVDPAAVDIRLVDRAGATPAVVDRAAVDIRLVDRAEATPAVVDRAAVDIRLVDRAEATPTVVEPEVASLGDPADRAAQITQSGAAPAGVVDREMLTRPADVPAADTPAVASRVVLAGRLEVDPAGTEDLARQPVRIDARPVLRESAPARRSVVATPDGIVLSVPFGALAESRLTLSPPPRIRAGLIVPHGGGLARLPLRLPDEFPSPAQARIAFRPLEERCPDSVTKELPCP